MNDAGRIVEKWYYELENKFSESNYGIENNKFKATIGDAMGWFKNMVTNEFLCGVKTNNWQTFDKNYGNIIIGNTLSAMNNHN